MSKLTDLSQELRLYEKAYKKEPAGCVVEGTPELLHRATSTLDELGQNLTAIKSRFIDGMRVHSQGDNESDAIECPFCGYKIASNDDYEKMRTPHCPQCGTKLIYGKGGLRMIQLREIALKYHLKYQIRHDRSGYHTKEDLLGMDKAGNWGTWLSRDGQIINITRNPEIQLSNSNQQLSLEDTLNFTQDINNWSRQYGFLFPLKTLFPPEEFEKIAKISCAFDYPEYQSYQGEENDEK